MAINQSNDDKGRNGGKMPLATSNDGASPWSKKSPANEWQGGRKAAGSDLPMRPQGGTPTGNPSATPRPGR
jgi:hypothetical protein